MPLTPNDYKQICSFLDVLARVPLTPTSLDEVKEHLSHYVEEPRIIPFAPLGDRQFESFIAQSQQAEVEAMKQQTKQILEQKGRKEEATGGVMAEIVSESDTPTYTQISEEVPHGAYLPLGDIVYKLSIEAGKRKLTADEAQTKRYLQQRGP